MRTRWTILGLAIGAVLGPRHRLGAGIGPMLTKAGAAVAVTGDGDSTSGWWAAMDSLHDQMGQWAQQHTDFRPGGMIGGYTEVTAVTAA